jgi:hypothetical protein
VFWQELEANKRKRDQTGANSAEPDPVLGIPEPGIAFKIVEDALGSTPNLASEPGGPSAGAPETGVPTTGALRSLVVSPPVPLPRRRIREAFKVQDGHSLGEQAVYAALWAAGQPHGDEARRLTIGYRTLSEACGLTVNNCKANLQALVKKLAIEPIAGHTSKVGTTYLIYSYPTILRRRQQAGMTHVIKTKGVVFVNKETGAPVSGIPQHCTGTEIGAPSNQTGTPKSNTTGIPVSATPIKNKEISEETTPIEEHSSYPLVVAAARESGVTLDDDAARRIVLRCEAFDERATESEIAHFLRAKAAQLRNSRTIDNLVGLLIKAVPQYFVPPANELASLRQRFAERAEHETERRREEADSAAS